jgi:hypothetical protein
LVKQYYIIVIEKIQLTWGEIRLKKQNTLEDQEALLRTIDILSMEVLRLKTENEILRNGDRQSKSSQFLPGVMLQDTLFQRIIIYSRREGIKNTIKRIISKMRPGGK